ncbi:MAG: serine/threonine-protein kinase [Myxococcota bacterium]
MRASDPAVPLQDQVRRRALKLKLFGGGDDAPTLGRYRLDGLLGEGAMGVVYRGHDVRLDRAVAIKVLRAESQQGTERLEREAQVLAKLSHPNVVTIHEVGDDDGHPFIAMEYVRGPTLRAWIEAPHSLTERMGVIRQAVEGLAAAHAMGLIHRDFKPDNAIVGEDGRVRLLDFGLATTPTLADLELATQPDVQGWSRITATGAVLGTPAYMAPEIFAGEPPTESSDQFALCCTAWEVLFGERPFGDTRGELRQPPANHGVPQRTVAALRRGLQTDPSRRHESLVALLRTLPSKPSGSRWPWVAAGMLVSTGGVAALLTSPGDLAPPAAPAPEPASVSRQCGHDPSFSDATRVLNDAEESLAEQIANAAPGSEAALSARENRAGVQLALGRWTEACTELRALAAVGRPLGACWTERYCNAREDLPPRPRCFAGDTQACQFEAIKHEYEYLDAKEALAGGDGPMAKAAADLHHGLLLEMLTSGCEQGHDEMCAALKHRTEK